VNKAAVRQMVPPNTPSTSGVRPATSVKRTREPGASELSKEEQDVVEELLHGGELLANLPVALTILGRNLRILYVSRPPSGDQSVRVVGTNALDHLKPEDRPRYTEAFETAWNTGRDQVLEFQIVTGQYWEARLSPARRNGEPVAMFATASETTARRQALADLRDNEQRLRLALEATGMGTWSWDVRTGEVHWDSVVCTLFGLEPEDVPKTYDDYIRLLHTDDRSRVGAALQTYLQTGRYDDLEHRIVRPDGEVRHVLAKATAIRDEIGEVVGFRGGVFDITTRKRLEEQLYQAQKMEAIGLLTAGIAHNFNNLLTVILPNVVLCRMDAEGEDAERLADVEYAARRAGELVRELMLVTRPNTGARKSQIDLVSACERAVEMSKASLSSRIRIELRAPATQQLVFGNATQLEQVLLNLCLNCRDAFDSGRTAAPRITISVEGTRSEFVRVRVTDNGPGMDEATRARVFEPFFTTKGRGTGLGLASAYAIIADHGGLIRCESVSTEGTSFEIELPRSGLAVNTPVVPRRIEASGGSETLLLIDDEELVRRALRNVLESAGYRVLEAAGGADGIAVFERERDNISLVLLDRSMPEMSGEMVLRRLLELGVLAPVMFVTGHQGGIDEGCGAVRVLPKPVDRETLLLAVREVIDASTVRRAVAQG
jgi:PAS domain S-box-containing protein